MQLLHARRRMIAAALPLQRATGFNVGARFFSRTLSQPTRLTYMGDNGSRADLAPALVPPKPLKLPWLTNGTVQTQQVRFNDIATLLVTAAASEEETRARLPKEHREEDVLIRFRTNIHVNVSVALSLAHTRKTIERRSPSAPGPIHRNLTWTSSFETLDISH